MLADALENRTPLFVAKYFARCDANRDPGCALRYLLLSDRTNLGLEIRRRYVRWSIAPLHCQRARRARTARSHTTDRTHRDRPVQPDTTRNLDRDLERLRSIPTARTLVA